MSKKALKGSALFNHRLKEAGHGNMWAGYNRKISEARAEGRREGWKEGFLAGIQYVLELWANRRQDR